MSKDKNANEISKLFKLPDFDLSKQVFKKPMGNIIKALAHGPAGTAYEEKRSQSDAELSWLETLRGVAAQIGNINKVVACKAMDKFLGFMYTHQYQFCEFLQKLLSESATVEEKRIMQESIHQHGPLASVAAYYEQQEQVSPYEALSWLGHESTEISTLASTPYRRIFFAKVDETQAIPRKHFKALWLKLTNECHIVLVSTQLTNTSELADAIWHELDHIRRHHFTLGTDSIKHANAMKEDIKMSKLSEEPTTKQQRIVPERKPLTYGTETPPFAIAQSRVDPQAKQLVASWVSQHLHLKSGAGIIIDAGSSCLEVWRAIVDQIEDNQFAFLTVYTNSYQVLEHWRDRLNNRQVQQTNVQLIGSKLDAEHLAFYGQEAVDKVMTHDFRAMNVYIGISGIEFDEEGRILVGYHADEPELQIKKLLFQCHAQKRIILATPAKIGFAGGRVFNVLDVKGLNTDAPIYLVTINPEKGSKEEKQFKQAMRVFQSKAMEHAISNKKMVLHWITIDHKNDGVPKMIAHLVLPKNSKRNIA